MHIIQGKSGVIKEMFFDKSYGFVFFNDGSPRTGHCVTRVILPDGSKLNLVFQPVF